MGQEKIYQGEINAFRERFSKFREKRIVLYGIGRYTAALLPGITDFNIAGLMDRDAANIGKTIFGLPVISKEMARTRADLIIINTAENYWKIIYERIREIQIPVYYLNGQLACRGETGKEYQNNTYWSKTSAELKKKIEQYDIISFDIFDTLIMRKVFIADDLYKIAERRITKKYNIEGFYKERLAAGAGSNDQNLSLDDIYKIMNKNMSLTDAELEKLKETEIQVEMDNIIPRRDLVEILNEIVKRKKVYLISDMYLPVHVIRRILKNCGVKNTDHIWVSSEKKKNKKSGALWEAYACEIIKGQRALHIGDNLISDVEMPHRYGIDTYYIMSAAEMLRNSSAGNVVSCIGSLEESVFAGLLCAKIFNSPFALSVVRGQILFNDFETLGYCLFGGLLYAFLVWLADEAKCRGMERVVFLARDGYWLKKNYQYLSKLSERPDIPVCSYLAISRRLVLAASCQSKADLEGMIRHPYSGVFSEYMYDRLDLEIDADDLHGSERVDLPYDYGKVMEWLEPYQERMMEKMEEVKKNYLSYLEKQELNEKDGIVDLWFYGNNQYYLMKTTGKRLTGFYFAVNQSKDNRCAKHGYMASCFQKTDDPLAKTCNVYKNSLWIESFLTAPYGMIKAVDQEGLPVCDYKGMNQNYWGCRERMYEGVCAMESDYIKVFEGELHSLDPLFIDRFWKEVAAGNIALDNCLKKVFFFDNRLVRRLETNIFE